MSQFPLKVLEITRKPSNPCLCEHSLHGVHAQDRGGGGGLGVLGGQRRGLSPRGSPHMGTLGDQQAGGPCLCPLKSGFKFLLFLPCWGHGAPCVRSRVHGRTPVGLCFAPVTNPRCEQVC